MVVEDNLSYREVGRRLNIDNSTISTWCRGLASSKFTKLIKNNELKREIVKKSETKSFQKIDINTDFKKILCGVIYGCEGAKYPATKHLGFTNSEPLLILSFINLLRDSFQLDESKFRIHLQIHSNQNYNNLVKFWSDLLNISSDKFYKPTITKPTDKKHRKGYLGTCTIKYYNINIQLKLIGIFNEFMRKFALLEDIPNGSGKSLLNFDA
ncbi:MAG: hypothetical protein UR11_C0001G0167 [Candidatus Woesebacteria bacterium GW2011_GWC1_30_29]|uniref:Uncharacterized protein n=1 Tax=Candidatus Woesebacteria bacterium GW2011_GWC2_31_9 TaxID=1618586 RepID=A0A0F9YKK6_9BACT|nr:MAG: hypothetical protein UR11_C0001G0167 [Candidatus Woesebacteria bacterium GW2011_GWC1_30_29]KKP26881.1 MAG: hypothetical protein UR13_C0002G0116 [Candidatus Woesebacteria bacterium GW2011_GWD1_31_12]KKP27455.1 MAG: hypothetical protein UR16_C0003G0115 [Candidatus Woesebacteria bacterium GW2011_GWB1_31_29]KKP31068.1 MAG: hypothetical protein UR20_C0044G0006 [Candidatus Woesebacteria bacterium GW2011_GWE2_31_6]KKP32029.1 MAG: hypothetical protein UR21_C0003G0062 [Candidatus Woesebacteria b